MNLRGVVVLEEKGMRETNEVDDERLLIGMATCHSLTVIEGELIGEPLDLEMFGATRWRLDEPNVEDGGKFDLLMPTVVRPNVGRGWLVSPILAGFVFERG